jgi:hypothetical protein
LQAVVRVARDDPVKESREHASIVIMNLALEDSNKVSVFLLFVRASPCLCFTAFFPRT